MFGAPDDAGDLIGVNIPRVDAPPKAEGSPVFAAGHKLSNALYMVPTLAAIANVVHDATGKRFTRLPITPERVALAPP